MRFRTPCTITSLLNLGLPTTLLLVWVLPACNGLIGLDDPKLNITDAGKSVGGSAGSSSTKASGGTGAAAGNSGTAGSSAFGSSTGGNGSGTTVGGGMTGGSSSAGTTGGNAGSASTTTSSGVPLASGGFTSAGGGISSTGGIASPTGGAQPLGGTTSTGGANPTGGTPPVGVGGVAQTGGANPTGGTSVGTGGSIATGGSTPTETTPPALTASSPTGTNANPTDSVTGTFSEPLNCGTVTSESFAVLDDTSAPIQGTLSCSGQTVMFKPGLGFTLNSSYQVKLTGALRDPAGNALADAPLSWSFRVREGNWDTTPVALDMTADANTPVVTLCDSGDAMVMWARNVGGGVSNAWSNRWVASNSRWVGAESVFADSEQYATPAGLACDTRGNYVATWTQAPPGYNAMYQVWTNRFSAGLGWGAVAKRLSTDANGAAMSVSQATQANGDTAVVWTQYNRMDGTNNHGWVTRYSASSGAWTDAAVFANDVNDCSVAMDASGRILGLFSSTVSANMNAFDWPPAAGIGEPVPVETNTASTSTGYSRRGIIRVDGAGTFLAVWVRPEDPVGRVLWNRKFEGMWGTPSQVDTGTADAGPLDLAVNPSGRASVVWPATDSTSGWIYQAQRAPTGTYWDLDGAKLTGYATTYPASEFWTATPKVVMDPKGNTIAVWRRGDANWSARLNALANPPRWTDAVQLNGANIGLDPVIAIHPSGVALAAWQENDATGTHIYVRWFR